MLLLHLVLQSCQKKHNWLRFLIHWQTRARIFLTLESFPNFCWLVKRFLLAQNFLPIFLPGASSFFRQIIIISLFMDCWQSICLFVWCSSLSGSYATLTIFYDSQLNPRAGVCIFKSCQWIYTCIVVFWVCYFYSEVLFDCDCRWTKWFICAMWLSWLRRLVALSKG